MKIDRLILPMTIIAIVCLQSVAGQDLPSQSASDQEYVWYTAEPPSDSQRLAVEGSGQALKDSNSLAIVDLSRKKTRTSLDIPSGNWVRLSLAPAADGELELFCLYPTGTVTSIFTDQAMKGNSYTAWYHSGLEGNYELWYTINGSKSNSVKFLVQDSQLAESMSPVAGGTPRSGSPGIAYSMAPPSALAASPSIGFSVGGAKDINNFRENIKQDYLPSVDRCHL